MTDIPEHINNRLEELGPDQVRHLMLCAGLPEAWRPHILTWFMLKDNEALKAKRAETRKKNETGSEEERGV